MADLQEEPPQSGAARVEVNRQVAVQRKAAKQSKDSSTSDVDWQEKMQEVLASGDLKKTLMCAYNFLQGRLPTQATGAACAVRPVDVLREAAKSGRQVAA